MRSKLYFVRFIRCRALLISCVGGFIHYKSRIVEVSKAGVQILDRTSFLLPILMTLTGLIVYRKFHLAKRWSMQFAQKNAYLM